MDNDSDPYQKHKVHRNTKSKKDVNPIICLLLLDRPRGTIFCSSIKEWQ
ncbi:hypothetical protein HNP81_001095 [Peribacillus huizhouensis]|uniref:Uncharacterized protein n=1 Tax=Peribacillus huizhouensis TaxID=1501239 RepID=A0ABR6CN59_9BACI|nr:hypothetical protein [Peribacillus huizhouensis]